VITALPSGQIDPRLNSENSPASGKNSEVCILR
jgi:hypothetical protein